MSMRRETAAGPKTFYLRWKIQAALIIIGCKHLRILAIQCKESLGYLQSYNVISSNFRQVNCIFSQSQSHRLFCRMLFVTDILHHMYLIISEIFVVKS
jgi:hypothetical protein